MLYAILDIEATGGKAGTEKIIDIAIYKFDGRQVIDKFGSMVNPERGIDNYVQKLTGITDNMVRRAPKFHELAKRVVEITEDCIIVGHGVHFDYRMLKQEFKELGYVFERATLDTVILSQKLIPEAPSHSLGKLCKSLGIPVSSRHRADGDTLATLELFKLLLEKDAHKQIIQTYAKKEPFSKKIVHKLLKLERNLPAKTGVFYFQDKRGKIIYIGASNNIANKVNNIFVQRNQNAHRIQSIVENITYEVTGSLLVALLKARDHAKGKKGLISLKSDMYNYGIFVDDSYNLVVNPLIINKKHPLLISDNSKKAVKAIKSLTNGNKKLNAKTIGQIKKDIKLKYKSFILLDDGREKGENSFIQYMDDKIIGYGFFKFYNQLENDEIREQLIIPLSNSIYNKALLKTFVFNNKYKKLIPLDSTNSIKIPTPNERFRPKNKR